MTRGVAAADRGRVVWRGRKCAGFGVACDEQPASEGGTYEDRLKDKLALATGQYLVELAEGERQCFHSISSHRVTFRCTSNFATNCAPLCMRAICDRATAFPPAVNSRPCSAFTARRWRMLTPNWNPKA